MHWTGTWTTSSASIDGAMVENQTLRMLVRTSIAGEVLRVRLSNAHGTEPITIATATIALRKGEAALIQAESLRNLTFGGENLISYISPPGDYSASADMPVGEAIESWYFLTCIEVMSAPSTRGIVAMGDSLTDANVSTPNTNNRWPDQLARRLVATRGPNFAGVMNQGIGGNRICYDGQADNGQKRFDRDVLAQPGVTHLLLLLGTNDLRNRRGAWHQEAQSSAMIAGLKQMGMRAKAAGLKAYVGTLMPLSLIHI